MQGNEAKAANAPAFAGARLESQPPFLIVSRAMTSCWIWLVPS
jgi:hypothetical protein